MKHTNMPQDMCIKPIFLFGKRVQLSIEQAEIVITSRAEFTHIMPVMQADIIVQPHLKPLFLVAVFGAKPSSLGLHELSFPCWAGLPINYPWARGRLGPELCQWGERKIFAESFPIFQRPSFSFIL